MTRPDVADTIAGTFEGLQVGVYRERNRLLPIIARAPMEERDDVAKIHDLQVWSPPAGQVIPLTQVVSDTFPAEWEDAIIQRRHRVPTIIVHADQATGNASTLHGRIKAPMEKMYADYMAKFADCCPHCGNPASYGILKLRPITIRRYTLQNGKMFWRRYDVYEGKNEADSQWLRDNGYVLLEDV